MYSGFDISSWTHEKIKSTPWHVYIYFLYITVQCYFSIAMVGNNALHPSNLINVSQIWVHTFLFQAVQLFIKWKIDYLMYKTEYWLCNIYKSRSVS